MAVKPGNLHSKAELVPRKSEVEPPYSLVPTVEPRDRRAPVKVGPKE